MTSLSLNEQHPDFKLSFAIAIIEHLGLNLYSEVHSAVAELIANAYDAEAKSVTVTLPIGIQLGLEGQQIIIEDNGHGMTYEDCRDKYLAIGRNRRRTARKSKNGRRVVIGKKGIGKLAGFGIANQMHIRTVSDGKLTEFIMNLSDIRAAKSTVDLAANLQGSDREDLVREYPPTLLAVDEPIQDESSTKVILEKIRPLDAIDIEDFKLRLSRKFAIFADDFRVSIVNANTGETTIVEKFDLPTQYRFPDSGWTDDNVETPERGPQLVKYWIGFTAKPIREESQRGISVAANGKSVQEPFYFRLSGGTTGQFGLQYVAGEIQADWLDESVVDVIASDRASVRWDDFNAQALLKWGQKLLREKLSTWAERRAVETRKRLREKSPEIEREIASYSGETQQELQRVVDRVVEALAEIDPDKTHDVVKSVVTAYRHDHIRTVLRKIIDGRGDIGLFVEALKEWDLIDAVQTFRELTIKAEAIKTLSVLILGRATEVRSKSGHLSMHEHLANYPWLIDPMFSEMENERNVDLFLLNRYGEQAKPRGDDKRADFIILYDSERIRLVEIKSAKDPLDKRGVDNLLDYHHRIQTAEAQQGRLTTLKSLLVYNGKVTSDAEPAFAQVKKNPSDFEVYTWNELLRRNENLYKEMINRVRAKNPDDPRVTALLEEANRRVEATKDISRSSHATTTAPQTRKRKSKKPTHPPGSEPLF